MRRPLIAAAAAAVALVLMPATSVADDTARGVDIAPPAVGSCHALTYAEGAQMADPDPAVPCTDAHTSITIKVVELDSPDYSNLNAILRKIWVPCWGALNTYFGDGAKALQMSAYSIYYFGPTKAQQDAGASWVRCDLVLLGGTKIMPLPTTGDPALGNLPHSNSIARCRTGKKLGFVGTVCSRPHASKTTHAMKRPGSYPGKRKMARWTVERCQAKLGRSFAYYTIPVPIDWRAGRRFSTCERG